MAVVEPPYWLERGYREVTANATTGGSASTLPMTDEQIEEAKDREAKPRPVGFTSPKPPTARKR